MQKGCNHISTLQSDQGSTGLFQNCLKESLLPSLPSPSLLPSGQGQFGVFFPLKKKKAVSSNKLNCHLTWAVLHHFDHVKKKASEWV